jgi:hypothetical protein
MSYIKGKDVNACENCVYWRRNEYVLKNSAIREDKMGKCYRIGQEIGFQFCYIGTPKYVEKENKCTAPLVPSTVHFGLCKFYKSINTLIET